MLFIATGNFVQNIPGPAARPHGSRRLRRLHGEGEGGDRDEVSAAAAARGIGAERQGHNLHRRRDHVRRLELHSREWSETAGAPDRRRRAEARAEDRRERRGEARRGCGGRARAAWQTARSSGACIAGERGRHRYTGMYYTPMGGDIMFVEASIRRYYGAIGRATRQRRWVRGSVIADSDRTAGRRHEGVGPRSVHLRDEQCREARHSARQAGCDRSAHPRARGRDSKGRTVSRHCRSRRHSCRRWRTVP